MPIGFDQRVFFVPQDASFRIALIELAGQDQRRTFDDIAIREFLDHSRGSEGAFVV